MEPVFRNPQHFLPGRTFRLIVSEPGRLIVNDNPRQPLNQLLEADLVYVRDFRDPARLTEEQLKHLALIAHHCYGSFDLALYCLLALEGRGSLPVGVQDRYLSLLGAGPAGPGAAPHPAGR